jgi:hypothetical protein
VNILKAFIALLLHLSIIGQGSFECFSIGIGSFQPLLYLFYCNLLRVVNHPVDLESSVPPFIDRENAWQPIQGRFTDVVSVDGKGGLSSIGGCPSHKNRWVQAEQQHN